MGLFEKLLGVPENSSISEEFNNVFSPQVSDDYKESYEAAERNEAERREREKSGFY